MRVFIGLKTFASTLLFLYLQTDQAMLLGCSSDVTNRAATMCVCVFFVGDLRALGLFISLDGSTLFLILICCI
jgi:hypothetical protein